MNKEIVTYHIQVKTYKWLDVAQALSVESDNAFLEAYPDLLSHVEKSLNVDGNDFTGSEYRAIKRTQIVTDEVLT